ncbi:hypothetical protein [Paenibacillus harenae]|nr:hypothetical protein [Paenibacillus harenae]
MKDIIAWGMVGFSFFGGAYICWIFGHALSRPLAQSIASFFF